MSAPIALEEPISLPNGDKFMLNMFPERILGEIAELAGLGGISNLWCSGDRILITKLASPSGIMILVHIDPVSMHLKRLPQMLGELKALRIVRLRIAHNGIIPQLNLAWIEKLPRTIEHLEIQCQQAASCWRKRHYVDSRDQSPPHTIIVRDMFPNLLSLSNDGKPEAATSDWWPKSTETLFWGFPESCHSVHLPLPIHTLISPHLSLEALSLGCLDIKQELSSCFSSLVNLHTLALNKLVRRPEDTVVLPINVTRLEMKALVFDESFLSSFVFPLHLLSLKMHHIDETCYEVLPPTLTTLSTVNGTIGSLERIPPRLSRLNLILPPIVAPRPTLRSLGSHSITRLTLQMSHTDHTTANILYLLPSTVTRVKLHIPTVKYAFSTLLEQIPQHMVSLKLDSQYSFSEADIARVSRLTASFQGDLQKLVVYNTIFMRRGKKKRWANLYDAIRENQSDLLRKLIQLGVVHEQMMLLRRKIELEEIEDELVALKLCSPIVLGFRFSTDLSSIHLLMDSGCHYYDPRINLYFVAAEHARWNAFMFAATFLPKSHLFPPQLQQIQRGTTQRVPQSHASGAHFINLGDRGLLWLIIRDGATHVLQWLRDEQGADLREEDVPTWGTALQMAISARKWETFAWLYTHVDDRIDPWAFAEKLASAPEQDVIRELSNLKNGITGRRLKSILSIDFIGDMLHNSNPIPILQWYLDQSVDLTAKDSDGCTLAHRILRIPETQRLELANWLWDRQVPFDTPNTRGVYPTYIWIERKQWELLKWAISKKIPLRDPNSTKTIIMLAQEYKAPQEIISMLEASRTN